MKAKQQAVLTRLQAAVAARRDGSTVEVIEFLPQGRLPKTRFPLDGDVMYVLVNRRGHVAISANGALDLPFVRSFPGSYFAAAVIAEKLEAQCDPDGYKRRPTLPSTSLRRVPAPVRPTARVEPRPDAHTHLAGGMLGRYFEAEDQSHALEAYSRFAAARGWGIEYKTELYGPSRRAFDPAAPWSDAAAAFRSIYARLSGGWQVFRNSSGPCWPADKLFETIRAQFSRFAWGGPVTLQNFEGGGHHQALVPGLEKMRDLKPVAHYPVMAVSKFLHFSNPALFPIYDNEVIDSRVLRCFRNDFRQFCLRSGVHDQYGDTASFLLAYMRWASFLVAGAHSGFMETFVEWLRQQPGAGLDKQTFDPLSLYATAFEFTAIGAWCVEAAGG